MTRLFLAFSLAACGGKSTPAPVPAPAPEAAPAPETMPEQPTAATGNCDQEVALVCTEGGLNDGCLVQDDAGMTLTLSHVCTAASKPGPPCDQEIALECAPAFTDACLTTPPLAKTHLCVQTGG